MINNHSIRTTAGLAVVFIIGALQAYHSGFNTQDVVTMLLAGFLQLEHALQGNTE